MNVTVKKMIPALLGVSLLTLAGCNCKAPAEPAPVLEAAQEESLDTKKVFGIGEGRTTEGMLPIYYSFDKSDVRADQQPRAQVNADFMAENSDLDVRVEGNTDSRGTNEYNMALGERRALAAKKAVMMLGVDEERLTTVSYGEERLLLTGQDEDSWAKNRRSDFVVVE